MTCDAWQAWSARPLRRQTTAKGNGPPSPQLRQADALGHGVGDDHEAALAEAQHLPRLDPGLAAPQPIPEPRRQPVGGDGARLVVQLKLANGAQQLTTLGDDLRAARAAERH